MSLPGAVAEVVRLRMGPLNSHECSYSTSAHGHLGRKGDSVMFVIETEALVKHYGKVQALRGVSLRVERGCIYGLLGRNGAGKTTLVRALLGIVRPTTGRAL